MLLLPWSKCCKSFIDSKSFKASFVSSFTKGGGGSLGGMPFRISAILLACFRKSADRNWLFPLFFKIMSEVFLLHIKMNHFLSILHVTDHTQALAVIMDDHSREKFCCCCCHCGCCLQIFVICIVFVCLSAFK